MRRHLRCSIAHNRDRGLAAAMAAQHRTWKRILSTSNGPTANLAMHPDTAPAAASKAARFFLGFCVSCEGAGEPPITGGSQAPAQWLPYLSPPMEPPLI